mmetsp:Transcript_2598/g.6225  ORF Transcript_2598/g.6225 Transcript_2598/m.6225 type:complete len:241 (+) Transcript_2598:986-1708(+)
MGTSEMAASAKWPWSARPSSMPATTPKSDSWPARLSPSSRAWIRLGDFSKRLPRSSWRHTKKPKPKRIRKRNQPKLPRKILPKPKKQKTRKPKKQRKRQRKKHRQLQRQPLSHQPTTFLPSSTMSGRNSRTKRPSTRPVRSCETFLVPTASTEKNARRNDKSSSATTSVASSTMADASPSTPRQRMHPPRKERRRKRLPKLLRHRSKRRRVRSPSRTLWTRLCWTVLRVLPPAKLPRVLP